MTTILIILAVLIVVVFVILSLYTSVNSGASRFGKWLEGIFNEKKD